MIDDLYPRIGQKENGMCKLAKAREGKTRDLSRIRYIKNEDERVLAHD